MSGGQTHSQNHKAIREAQQALCFFDGRKGQIMRKDRRKHFITAAMTMLMTAYLSMNSMAAEAVTSKINSLYDIVLGIITAAGVIVLAWGIFEFASAYQSRDTAQQTDSLKKVVSGIIMVAAPTIINLLK